MTFGPDDIDRIVSQVLQQLREGSSLSGESVAPSQPIASAVVPESAVTFDERKRDSVTTDGQILELSEAVITADVLQQRLTTHRQIRVRPAAVLTPSARDVLRIRKLECLRDGGDRRVLDSARWLAVTSRTTSVLSSVLEQLHMEGQSWVHRLSGTVVEATRMAVTALCTAEAAGAVVLTGDPELAACLANRNSRVRAAMADSMEAVQRVRRTMQPNLLTLNPAGKSLFELRNLFRAVAAMPLEPPPGWLEV